MKVQDDLIPARVINLSRAPVKIHAGQTVFYLEIDAVVASVALDEDTQTQTQLYANTLKGVYPKAWTCQK